MKISLKVETIFLQLIMIMKMPVAWDEVDGGEMENNSSGRSR